MNVLVRACISAVVRWFPLVLLVLATTVLPSCRPEPKPVKLTAPMQSSSLGPGDVFVLYITGEDKLPTEFTVAPDGTVDVPSIERIEVAGLEVQQVSALVRQKLLAAQIYTDPSVSVSIKAYNSKRVTVTGEVEKDGSFSFEPGMMISDAIALAGGMTSLARTWKVVLVRKTEKGSERAIVDMDAVSNNEIPDVPLQAGDKITVPQRPF